MHKNPRFPFSKSGTAFKLLWFTENLETSQPQEFRVSYRRIQKI